MIRRTRSTLAILAAVAMLSACHSQPKAGHGEVSGQILPGSVSDAMLPYDTVKSKAPLAPKEATAGPDDGADDGAADSADTAATADSATPDASASPAPAAPAPGN